MSALLDCSVCGFRFDPAGEAACGSCPLRGGCALVCCPACGHVAVDTGRSRLARLAASVVHRDPPGQNARVLAEVPAGRVAVVTGFDPALDGGRCQQLQAYGLAPGRQVAVVQHRPVTVVSVDHTEIALEGDVGRMITVAPQPAA